MKKQIVTLIAIAASTLLLVGCQQNSTHSNSQQAYTTIMAKGNKAIQKQDFAAAQAYYQAAATTKKDDTKAKTYAQQADNLVSAQKSMNAYSFAEAKSTLHDVKDVDNGSQKMQEQADNLLQLVKKVVQNRKDYRSQIETAATASDNKNYTAAQDTISKLLQKTEFHKKYYGDLFKQATEILLTSSQNLQNNDADTNNEAPTEKNTPAASAGSEVHGESDAIKNPTANGKKIGAADIQKARKQLRDQGEQDSAASDSDIIRAIQKAASEGRSTITPSDAGF